MWYLLLLPVLLIFFMGLIMVLRILGNISGKMVRRQLLPTLFPYTTLFRSHCGARSIVGQERDRGSRGPWSGAVRSEEHTSELQSRQYLVCRLLLEKKKVDIFDGIDKAVADTWHNFCKDGQADGIGTTLSRK